MSSQRRTQEASRSEQLIGTNDNSVFSVEDKFRELLRSLEERSGESGNTPDQFKQSAALVIECVETANILLNTDDNTTKLLVQHGEALLAATDQAVEASHSMTVGEVEFNLFAWAEAVKAKAVPLEDESPSQALASATGTFIRKTVPMGYSPLAGCFELSSDEIPQQKKRAPADKKSNPGEKKKPEMVVETEDVDAEVQQSVKQAYMKIKRHYKANNKQPLDYFRLVIDPTSFNKSVENIFYISFLVRDNHVKLEPSDIGGLLISPISAKREKENLNSSHETEAKEIKHLIIPLDVDSWEELIDLLEIDTAML